MDAEKELADGWQRMSGLQRRIAVEALTLAEQASLLEKEIDQLAPTGHANAKNRVELLARLCLLSEICAAIDFDRMIEAREKFQALLPTHFPEYLSHLDSLTWDIGWSGCLECRHFAGRCTLGLTPQDLPESHTRLDKHCTSKIKRSRNL